MKLFRTNGPPMTALFGVSMVSGFADTHRQPSESRIITAATAAAVRVRDTIRFSSQLLNSRRLFAAWVTRRSRAAVIQLLTMLSGVLRGAARSSATSRFLRASLSSRFTTLTLDFIALFNHCLIEWTPARSRLEVHSLPARGPPGCAHLACKRSFAPAPTVHLPSQSPN